MRPSSIDRLDPEIREAIGRLREGGRTLDEILAHLRALEVSVSRSALGRHVRGLEKAGERLRRTRAIAEALVPRLGDGGENRVARLNIELMHGAINGIVMRAAEAEEAEGGGAGEDGEDRPAPTMEAKEAMELSKGLLALAQAQKIDAEFLAKVEERAAARAREAAAKEVERVGKERGIGRDTLDAIKAGIFGVKAAAPAVAGRPA